MKFEDLDSWKKARLLVNGIYCLSRMDHLNNDYGLSSQIQRAGVSIMTNIAEGFERQHLKEKIQFYNVARASTGEVRSLLYVVIDNCPESRSEAKNLMTAAEFVGRLISGLIKSTEKRKRN